MTDAHLRDARLFLEERESEPFLLAVDKLVRGRPLDRPLSKPVERAALAHHLQLVQRQELIPRTPAAGGRRRRRREREQTVAYARAVEAFVSTWPGKS
eukprot:5787984-Pleurochrysis_carterae.AAC.13